jgi:phage gp45-like
MKARVGDYVRTKIYPLAGQIIDMTKDGIIIVQFPAMGLCHTDDLELNPDQSETDVATWRVR